MKIENLERATDIKKEIEHFVYCLQCAEAGLIDGPNDKNNIKFNLIIDGETTIAIPNNETKKMIYELYIAETEKYIESLKKEVKTL